MKKVFMFAWVLFLILAVAMFAVAKVETEDVEVTGWVSDESCGAEHTKPGGEDCVQKCIKGAPHLNPEWVAQRMVFVTDDQPEIWFVENPDALRGYEGKHMRITGKLDTEAKSVRVEDASPLDER